MKTAFCSCKLVANTLSKQTCRSRHSLNLGRRISSRNFFTFIYEYENAVTFTFGRLSSVKRSGIRLFIPSIQEMYRVDLRTRINELTPQKIITTDNVSCEVNAVIYFHVINPKDAVMQVDDVDDAINQLAQTELRDLLCQQSFNQILESREHSSHIIQERLKEKSDKWGVVVEHVQLKNIDLTEESMVRAMAKEAEASRERRAALIRASGEEESAYKLREAAKLISHAPIGLELRQLQTVERISKEPNQQTYILPDSVMEDSDALLGTAMSGTFQGKDGHITVFDDEDDDQNRNDIDRGDQNSLSNNNNNTNNSQGDVSLSTLVNMLRGGNAGGGNAGGGNEPVFKQ